jgi:hypothetical protein
LRLRIGSLRVGGVTIDQTPIIANSLFELTDSRQREVFEGASIV